MARKKTRKLIKPVKVFPQKRSFTDIIEAYGRQLIIGSIVLIALLGVFSNQIFKKEPSVVVSPTPTIAVTPRVSSVNTPASRQGWPTPIKTKDTAVGALTNRVTTPAPKLVTKLPLTAGETVLYTVKKNDSIAKLGLTFCNDKRAWMIISEDNKIYSPYTIQPEDVLIISCPR